MLVLHLPITRRDILVFQNKALTYHQYLEHFPSSSDRCTSSSKQHPTFNRPTHKVGQESVSRKLNGSRYYESPPELRNPSIALKLFRWLTLCEFYFEGLVGNVIVVAAW